MRSDIDFVFPAAVRDVGDPAAIGGPSHLSLANPRGSGEVADAAFFGRDGKHVTPGTEHGALPFRRNIEIGDTLAYVGPVLHRLVAFAGQVDVQFFRTVRLRIEGVEVAGILEYDRIRPQARPHDIEIGEVGQLLSLFSAEVVAVKIQAMFWTTVGAEIDGIAVPHGEGVGPFGVRQVF